ncbi:MAG: Rpn family recombination-promoting nuclease/putative transposase, partial [Deltaproteobacteria bacterium]|nr:Rpn family recombination-promoting nuclease/putative transposase [Nannocystaceae bacterium]
MTSRPHDALFRSAFEQPAHAAGTLRHVLSADLAAAVDWRTLRLEPGSFVDPELADHHTDLLFSARLGGAAALIYVLLEHQSTADR